MPFLDVPDATLYYEVRGHGPLVALVGAPMHAEAFAPLADLLADQALHALSSDWAFMVSKDSAAGYARSRADLHAGRVAELSGLLRAGRRRAGCGLAGAWRAF